MKKYHVTFTVTVEIDVAEEILALHQDKRWVENFYRLDTPEKVATHLAWSCGVDNRWVSDLDGFADRQKEEVEARILPGTESEVELVGQVGRAERRSI